MIIKKPRPRFWGCRSSLWLQKPSIQGRLRTDALSTGWAPPTQPLRAPLCPPLSPAPGLRDVTTASARPLSPPACVPCRSPLCLLTWLRVLKSDALPSFTLGSVLSAGSLTKYWSGKKEPFKGIYSSAYHLLRAALCPLRSQPRAPHNTTLLGARVLQQWEEWGREQV